MTTNRTAAAHFDTRVAAITAILDGNVLVAINAVIAADEAAAHDEAAARDRAAAEAVKPLTWKRTADGLESTDGRFQIFRVVEWILGTRCVSFSLYDHETPGARRVHSGRQAECKAVAQHRHNAA